MKKIISSFLVCTLLISFSFANEKEESCPGNAAKCGKETAASTIAWASFGISLLVVVGVITAITISKD